MACNLKALKQTILMPRLLFSVCAVLFVGIGCSKNSSPATTNSAGANAGSPSATSEASLANVLAELTQAVRKFSVEQRRVPASLNDLVAAGYIKNLPQPPVGKTFGIDSKNLQVLVK